MVERLRLTDDDTGYDILIFYHPRWKRYVAYLWYKRFIKRLTEIGVKVHCRVDYREREDKSRNIEAECWIGTTITEEQFEDFVKRHHEIEAELEEGQRSVLRNWFHTLPDLAEESFEIEGVSYHSSDLPAEIYPNAEFEIIYHHFGLYGYCVYGAVELTTGSVSYYGRKTVKRSSH